MIFSLALFWLVPGFHEVICEFVQVVHKELPGNFLGDQDHGIYHLFDIYKAPLKLKFLWQPDGLAAAVLEQFCFLKDNSLHNFL